MSDRLLLVLKRRDVYVFGGGGRTVEEIIQNIFLFYDAIFSLFKFLKPECVLQSMGTFSMVEFLFSLLWCPFCKAVIKSAVHLTIHAIL